MSILAAVAAVTAYVTYDFDEWLPLEELKAQTNVDGLLELAIQLVFHTADGPKVLNEIALRQARRLDETEHAP